MKTLGERVAALRAEKGWTQGQLADEVRRVNRNLGTRQSAIQAIEGGVSKKPTIIIELSTALGTNAEWLRTGKGSRDPDTLSVTPVPIFGYAGAGEKVEIIPSDDHGPIDEIQPLRAEDGFRAVVVRGRSMLPTYKEGDVLFFREDHVSPEKIIDRECLVITKDENFAYVKLVRKSKKKDRYDLISYNNDVEPLLNKEIERAWPIEWIRRK